MCGWEQQMALASGGVRRSRRSFPRRREPMLVHCQTLDLLCGKCQALVPAFAGVTSEEQTNHLVQAVARYDNARIARALLFWRPGSESNRRTRLCRPLHDHSATRPVTCMLRCCKNKTPANRGLLGLERETRLELATSTLARLRSTN